MASMETSLDIDHLLQCVTKYPQIRRICWRSEVVRRVILTAAASGAGERADACDVMDHLALEDDNQREMWEHADTRLALFKAACGADVSLRASAVSALGNIAHTVHEM